MLPGDSHVHSEWSYDARSGSMERSCARAVDLLSTYTDTSRQSKGARRQRPRPGGQHPRAAVPRDRRLVARGGGSTVTFGSDAHDPAGVARGFGQAAAIVEAQGFRPGRHAHDSWIRVG